MKFQPAPVIAPLLWNVDETRPYWSVMIPTYRPAASYLRVALESVLQQDIGPERMQIEVVDDCSPDVDTEGMVRAIAGNRIIFSRTPKNLGLAGCWNACIERAHGQWVHILHQDDYILPGFYKTLKQAAELHPEVSLLATRSFVIDEQAIISSVTPRLTELENGGRTVNDFFYNTPILCPAVVVKRDFYEKHGGFRSDLSFVLDCEMWARAVSSAGGLVTPEVLSCYRMSSGNQTTGLFRTGESLRDFERLNRLFMERYPKYDAKKGRQTICELAIMQAERFAQNGDEASARINLDYWKRNAPIKRRLRRSAIKLARKIFG